ncbi:MAG: YhbY family RNA-binding protein [Candidatus Bathyarchaeota archaeon]|nr:YhbY family RNA-binding protein [Candidatus Bathyarchaeota archaeon]
MITPEMRRRIKRELSAERPTVWIGKNGISQEVLVEVDGQLERTEMVKVRILKAALEENNAKAIADEIAQQTESVLVEVRGHTFMLYRKKKKT